MAEIKTQEIEYSADGVRMKGYLAWDGGIEGQRPGVLVVHEWWGANDYVRKRSEMLAELGYTAMAADLYGDGKTVTDPESAGKLMNELLNDLPGVRARFNAALDELRSHSTVNPGKTAAIGYCLGGGVVLHMARYGANLNAVASFHGSLPLGIAQEAGDANVTARIVAYNGEDDSFVPAAAITAFKEEMERLKADSVILRLPRMATNSGFH